MNLTIQIIKSEERLLDGKIGAQLYLFNELKENDSEGNKPSPVYRQVFVNEMKKRRTG